jgi:glycosyltransferase involved in cell wall biosynthesis
MFDMALWSRRLAGRFDLPLAITIHTMIRHTVGAYNVLLYPADRLLLRQVVVDHADALLCPDVNIVRYVEQAFPRTPAELVPYGINLAGEPSAELVSELRSRYHLEGKRVILSLGHVHDVRNRRDLVRALPAIRREHGDVVVLIVGSESTDAPRRIARQVGVEDAVIFAGPRPYHEVPGFFALADIECHLFYQDDPEHTSLGIASLEAMGAGLTTIAAANPDTYGPGVLVPGENVVMVPPHDPESMASIINELLGDAARRECIARAATEVVAANFTWDAICRRTLEVYDKARQRHGRKRSHSNS